MAYSTCPPLTTDYFPLTTDYAVFCPTLPLSLYSSPFIALQMGFHCDYLS